MRGSRVKMLRRWYADLRGRAPRQTGRKERTERGWLEVLALRRKNKDPENYSFAGGPVTQWSEWRQLKRLWKKEGFAGLARLMPAATVKLAEK